MSNKVSALAIKEHTFGSSLSSTNTWCTNVKFEVDIEKWKGCFDISNVSIQQNI